MTLLATYDVTAAASTSTLYEGYALAAAAVAVQGDANTNYGSSSIVTDPGSLGTLALINYQTLLNSHGGPGVWTIALPSSAGQNSWSYCTIETDQGTITVQESSCSFETLGSYSVWIFYYPSETWTSATMYAVSFYSSGVTGEGDITDPGAWKDANGNIPPQQFSDVPANTSYPLNGDGRYWWEGNAYSAPLGNITFIGNPSYYTGEGMLTAQVVQAATDGSSLILNYSTNNGSSYTSITLGPTVQNEGLLTLPLEMNLEGCTGLLVGVTVSGGTASSSAATWQVAVAITRNADSKPIWDAPNPYDPVAYNGEVTDDPGYDNLGTLTTRMLIRLGFANQTTNPPPGMTALLQEFLQSAQNFLYRRYSQLRTRRWFRWKIIPNQRFYSLLDNDENVLEGYSLDPDKNVIAAFIQDTRNVWYPLIEGIPAQLYTMIDKPWRPARYEIRNAIEVYPAPDQTYWMWMKAHFGLQSFSNASDVTTIDSELVFLHALANAKAHYGQPDANNIEAQANAMRAELIASSHKTARYVPGTIPVPPAVRPTLIAFDSNQGG